MEPLINPWVFYLIGVVAKMGKGLVVFMAACVGVFLYIRAGQLKAVKIGKAYRITPEAMKQFTQSGTEPDYLRKLVAKVNK